MTTNKGSIATIAFLLLGIGPRFACAESLVIPAETSIYPSPSAGASSYELSFALAVNNAGPTQLYFDGSIVNPSFFNSQTISFWFDWTDIDRISHASEPESFTLDPHLGIWSSHSLEYLSREFTIPYSPAEVSIHFVNETTGSLDGQPALVSGTFSAVPEPASLALFIAATFMVLPNRRGRIDPPSAQ
jgi:hypothetical protein